MIAPKAVSFTLIPEQNWLWQEPVSLLAVALTDRSEKLVTGGRRAARGKLHGEAVRSITMGQN